MDKVKRLLCIQPGDNSSYFLFGPRGTGKTTWVKKHFMGSVYIDLLDQKIYFELQNHPENLWHYFPEDASQCIIIDEVQKIPALLNEVHRAIEQDGRRFILTGSSARSLRNKGVNLLAGRALQLTMHPLTAVELKGDFNLANALEYGQLPQARSSVRPKDYLISYVNTYLREEVLQEGLTRKIQAFHRFLEVASFSHGEQINMTGIAREVGVDQKVIDNYFSILEDLLIAWRLPVFTRRAKRKVVQHPKFYFFDAGVYQTLRPRGPLDSPSEINGPALEGLVLQELIAINNYLKRGYQFYFWRTVTQIEVDFIAYGENGLLAFEIKHKSYIDTKDLKSLKAFQSDYPVAQCYLLYRGEQRKIVDGIHIVPVSEALSNLDQLLP